MTGEAQEVQRLRRIQRMNTVRWSIAAVFVGASLLMLVSLVVDTIGDLQTEVTLLRVKVTALEDQVRDLGGRPVTRGPSSSSPLEEEAEEDVSEPVAEPSPGPTEEPRRAETAGPTPVASPPAPTQGPPPPSEEPEDRPTAPPPDDAEDQPSPPPDDPPPDLPPPAEDPPDLPDPPPLPDPPGPPVDDHPAPTLPPPPETISTASRPEPAKCDRPCAPRYEALTPPRRDTCQVPCVNKPPKGAIGVGQRGGPTGGPVGQPRGVSRRGA